MAAAEKARAAGRCADVRDEAAEVLRLDPKNLLIRDLASCAAPSPTGRRSGRPPGADAPVRRSRPPTRGEAPRRAEAAKADGPDRLQRPRSPTPTTPTR